MIGFGVRIFSWSAIVTNKIGTGGIENRPTQVGSGAVKRTTDASTKVDVAAVETKAGEGVHITDSAKQLAALEQAIRSLPDVDDARVNEIRQAITDGRYEVSPSRIADRLIRLEQELNR
jgi:negative regulator of flagellin synthesis FlgM